MDPLRKTWNEQQQKLQDALKHPFDHPEWVDLFFNQHAALHAQEMSGLSGKSFEEDVWEGLSVADARLIPNGSEHSIAWIFWHLARIEDMTMNVLLAGGEQVFSMEWQARLRVQAHDTGNAMTFDPLADLSTRINLQELRGYRSEVGRSTRAIVQALDPALLRQRVPPERIERLRASGDVLPEASGLLDYWGGRTFAGLLLMPPTRHCFLHLNEAVRIKDAVRGKNSGPRDT